MSTAVYKRVLRRVASELYKRCKFPICNTNLKENLLSAEKYLLFELEPLSGICNPHIYMTLPSAMQHADGHPGICRSPYYAFIIDPLNYIRFI
jgi:hypothetical protein